MSDWITGIIERRGYVGVAGLTMIWTVALTYAGVALQSNFTLVGDYINMVTNVVLAVIGIMIAARYVRCWRSHASA